VSIKKEAGNATQFYFQNDPFTC